MTLSLREVTAQAVELGDLVRLVPEGYERAAIGFRPENNWEGPCECVAVRFGTTKAGFPSVGMQLHTEDKVKFWVNLFYSASEDANLITIEALSKWGVTPEFLDSLEDKDDDAANDMIVEQLITHPPVLTRIRHNEGDDGMVFLRPIFIIPDEDAVTDDDADWEDA